MTVCSFMEYSMSQYSVKLVETKKRDIVLKKIISSQIEDMCVNFNVNFFVCGLEFEIEPLMAENVILLKRKYRKIFLEGVFSTKTLENNWGKYGNGRFFNIIKRCNIQTKFDYEYNEKDIKRRNKYMIDKSDIMMTLWDGDKSNDIAADTISYAQDQGVKTIVINPKTLEITKNIW